MDIPARDVLMAVNGAATVILGLFTLYQHRLNRRQAKEIADLQRNTTIERNDALDLKEAKRVALTMRKVLATVIHHVEDDMKSKSTEGVRELMDEARKMYEAAVTDRMFRDMVIPWQDITTGLGYTMLSMTHGPSFERPVKKNLLEIAEKLKVLIEELLKR